MNEYKRILAQLEERKCKVCNGEGQVTIVPPHDEKKKCEKCKGTGLIYNELGRRPRVMENKFR